MDFISSVQSQNRREKLIDLDSAIELSKQTWFFESKISLCVNAKGLAQVVALPSHKINHKASYTLTAPESQMPKS